MSNEDNEKGVLFGPEDSYYISPTQKDIEDMVVFAIAHKEFTPYVEEAWDCDNFAREAKHWMDVWSLRHYRHSRSAIAVGMAYVRLSDPDGELLGYHAMNVIRRNDGQWFFYEPQNGQLIPVDGPLSDGCITVLRITM
jgi:hypothetical protein